jgi:hypothetical protein
MSDVETIFVVLAAFYFVESASLLTGAGRTFGSQWGRLFRPRAAEGLWGNESRSVHIAPVSPMGAMLITEHWPISVGPEGVLGFNASAPGLRFRPTSTERFISFNDNPVFESDGAKLLADRKLLARTTRPELAAWLVGILTQAASLPESARAAALDQRIGGAFQTEPCRQRWEQVQKESKWVRLTGTIGFVWVFIGGMGYYYLVRDLPFALRALVGYWSVALFGWIWAMVEFYIAHKKLYPSRPAERFKTTVEMILPATAMRGYNRLLLPSLAGWHPLAVASVVCNESDFRGVAREFFRDLEHPLGPFGKDWSDAARRTEAWHRDRVKSHAEALLAEKKIELVEVFAPPPKDDPNAAAWCPRCEREFGSNVGTCHDCGGIPLRKF